MTPTPPVSTYTLGEELERDRLMRRVRRVTLAIACLRHVASERRRERDGFPRQLQHAIADFEVQIDAMNARLRDLAAEPGSVQMSDPISDSDLS